MINSNKESDIYLLRQRSKAWHSIIDQFGISQALKNNAIDTHQYQAWLCHNLSYAEYILSEVDIAPDKYSLYHKYLPTTEHIRLLRSDINDHYISCTKPVKIDQKEEDMPAMIPVYIYQGSVMGKKMIQRFLKDRNCKFSMQYINQATDNSNMKDFLQDASMIKSQLNQEKFIKAIDLMWGSIIENYRHYTNVSQS